LDKLPLRFIEAHDFGIVVRKLLQRFPGEDLVIARRYAAKREVSVLIAARRVVKIEAVSFLIRNKYGLRLTHGLLFLIDNRAVNLTTVGADDDIERTGVG